MNSQTNVNASSRMKTLDLVYIALFSVLIAVCAWITIPAGVPFTMQIFGVALTIGLLGGKRKLLAVIVYILLGAVGIPVFSGFRGGFGHLLGTTGGYIIGYIFMALVMWAMEKIPGKRQVVRFISMVLALAVCYFFGSVWYMIAYSHSTGAIGFGAVLAKCVFPFIIPDLIKLVMAEMMCRKLGNMI